ncbi:glutathione S-transferase Mu 1 [Eurytemora carolleeae]|uniref:glutathione S-transferase Mu 1 n=1 Tax=Eurytemora carolleeae TaxID=1294199 RepID=UPI000C772409|nr:glutathione S-transferase Mu 1 [Eurytemora carolleeae]|eukprot:XP_023322391.1 glutathione S-transferase Mu 1-like [Eurytemora affinis]
MAKTIVLGYWDVRGNTQPARLILEHVGAQYEDRRILMSRPDWMKYKQTLGYDFPNLPFYQDEDVKITQSMAIIQHLGCKFGLDGSTLKDKADVDLLLYTAVDLREAIVGLCYRPNVSPSMIRRWAEGGPEKSAVHAVQAVQAVQRKSVLHDIPWDSISIEKRFTPLQRKLGGNVWFVNNEITIADFLIWEVLDIYRLLFPGCLEKLPGLSSFHARFAQIKGVKQYIESPRYKPFPIWKSEASYGHFEPNFISN